MAGDVKLDSPQCGKCRWATRAFSVEPNPFDHLDLNGNQYLGLYVCEQTARPRGLVPAFYSCRDFERPPVYEATDAIEARRAALRSQP